MVFSRRGFLKSSSVLSLLSARSFAASDSGNRYFLSRDKTGSIFAVESQFPFAKTLLISKNQNFHGITLNPSRSGTFFVQTAAGEASPYVVFVQPTKDQFQYQCVYVHGLQGQEDPAVSNVRHINEQSWDQNNISVLNDEDGFAGAVAHKNHLYLCFHSLIHKKLKLVIWDGASDVLRATFVYDFDFHDDMALSLVPGGIFGTENLTFLVMDHNSRSHRFYEIREKNSHHSMNFLCEIFEGQELSADWTFHYATVHPNYNNLDVQPVDLYALPLHSTNNQCCPWICHRANGTLGVLQFVQDREQWQPRVIAVGDQVFGKKDLHFYGALFDADLGRTVALMQNMSTGDVSVLDVVEGKLRCHPVTFSRSDSKTHESLWDYFYGDEVSRRRISLMRSASTENQQGVSLGLVKFDDLENDREFHTITLEKGDVGYVVRSSDQILHAPAPTTVLFQKVPPVLGISSDELRDEAIVWQAVGFSAALVIFGIFVWVYCGQYFCFDDVTVDGGSEAEEGCFDDYFDPEECDVTLQHAPKPITAESFIAILKSHFLDQMMVGTGDDWPVVMLTAIFERFTDRAGAAQLATMVCEDLAQHRLENFNLQYASDDTRDMSFGDLIGSGRFYRQNNLSKSSHYTWNKKAGKYVNNDSPISNRMKNLREGEHNNSVQTQKELIILQTMSGVFDTCMDYFFQEMSRQGFFVNCHVQPQKIAEFMVSDEVGQVFSKFVEQMNVICAVGPEEHRFQLSLEEWIQLMRDEIAYRLILVYPKLGNVLNLLN